MVVRDILSIYVSSLFNTAGTSVVSPILFIYIISVASSTVASFVITIHAYGRVIAEIPVGITVEYRSSPNYAPVLTYEIIRFS